MVMWIVVSIAYIMASVFVGLVPILIIFGGGMLCNSFLPEWRDVYREVAIAIILILGYHNWREYKRKTTPKYTLPKDLYK